MKVGIVVPFSWSFWGAVTEHAELQAEALGGLGIETRTIIITQARCPVVGTWHAAGPLRLNRAAVHLWGFLMERVDYKIAVSEQARASLRGAFPGPFEIIPNGVVPDGIGVLGLFSHERLTEELLSAKALVAPSVGIESFGMVLARALACALPVVASDLPGYRSVMTPEIGVLVPPADPAALTGAVAVLLEDEPLRRALGADGRRLAVARYSLNRIAARLAEVYEHVAGARVPVAAPTRLEPVPA